MIRCDTNKMILQILHLDGVQARPPKLPQFNKGNVRFELLIKETTVVSTLGIYEPTALMSIPDRVELCEIINTSTRIRKLYC